MAYALTREVELAVLEEATYGTSPGSPVGADFFKQTSRLHITPNIARYDRDQDGDYQQASVLSTEIGRQSSDVKIECDVIPSAAGTPTEPDIDVLLKHHFGQKHKGTAHTTTGAGCTGTTFNLNAGGGAASGIAIGDLVAVDQDGAGNYEVRRIVSGATDSWVIDNAFTTAAPSAGRAVKLGTTYRFLNTYALSLQLDQWIAATVARHRVPGLILPDLELGISFANEAPKATLSFSGKGKAEITHAVARPTPVTAGRPLVPSRGFAWVGANKLCVINATLKSNNGFELRENEGCSLEPTAPKRTGNNGRYNVSLDLEALYQTGTPDTVTAYDSAKTLPGLNTLVQLGITPGMICAFSLPSWKPVPERSEIDGEFGVKFSGRAYGTVGDDDCYLAFI